MKYYEQGLCTHDRRRIIDMLVANIIRIRDTESEKELIKEVGYAQENINMLAYDRYLKIRRLKTCKNCKYYPEKYGFMELCDIVGEYFTNDAYCDQWEKRE